MITHAAPLTHPRMHRRPARGRKLQVMEIAIVALSLGIIAGTVVPRLSEAASAGSDDERLRFSLAALRSAIRQYHDDFGNYPSATPVAALDMDGVTYALTRTAARAFEQGTTQRAAYLREIPELPVGANKGQRRIGIADGPGIAWIYDPATGEITANTGTETDRSGRLYRHY